MINTLLTLLIHLDPLVTLWMFFMLIVQRKRAGPTTQKSEDRNIYRYHINIYPKHLAIAKNARENLINETKNINLLR